MLVKLNIRKEKINELIKKMLVIFIVIQPLLDIYMVLCDKKIQIMGNSLATIVRFAVVFIMLTLTIYNNREKKTTKWLYTYLTITVIYFILHHLNVKNFNVNLNQMARYSLTSEIFYMLRMIVPVMIIYIIYNLKLKYEDIKKAIIGTSIVFSSVIIITNFLNISFIAYSIEDEFIKDNIIGWFTGSLQKYHWIELTSRGLFNSANQIAGILVMILPIVVYIALREKKYKYWLVVAAQMLCMLMITTRIVVVGALVIFVGMNVLNIMIILFNNKKAHDLNNNVGIKINIIMTTCIFTGYCILLVHSPFGQRLITGEATSDIGGVKNEVVQKIDTVDEKITLKTYDEKINYIEKYYKGMLVSEYHLKKAYPYKQDPDFWVNIIKDVPLYKRNGNRPMRALIMKRVYELNNNKLMDSVLGMSYTKTSTFLWPEEDFKTHFYSIGLIGIVLFLGPYVIILLFSALKIFCNIKKCANLDNLAYVGSLLVVIAAGIYSGNVVDEIFVSIYIGFISGYILNNVILYNDKEMEKK